MKATELRIGNLICREDLGDSHELFETIIELGKKVKTTGPINVICSYDEIKPVPLTEEWLNKFGFEKHDATANVITWSNHSLSINTYSRENVGYYWLKWYQHPKQSKIKHVHQLQNLYFALTGKELECTGI